MAWDQGTAITVEKGVWNKTSKKWGISWKATTQATKKTYYGYWRRFSPAELNNHFSNGETNTEIVINQNLEFAPGTTYLLGFSLKRGSVSGSNLVYTFYDVPDAPVVDTEKPTITTINKTATRQRTKATGAQTVGLALDFSEDLNATPTVFGVDSPNTAVVVWRDTNPDYCIVSYSSKSNVTRNDAINIFFQDKAGNTAKDTLLFKIKKYVAPPADTTKPIINVGTITTSNTRVNFPLTSNENVIFKVVGKLDNVVQSKWAYTSQSVKQITYSLKLSEIPEGSTVSLEITGTDSSNNASTITETWTRGDTTKPVVSVPTTTHKLINNNDGTYNIVFYFESSEDGTLSLNGGSFNTDISKGAFSVQINNKKEGTTVRATVIVKDDSNNESDPVYTEIKLPKTTPDPPTFTDSWDSHSDVYRTYNNHLSFTTKKINANQVQITTTRKSVLPDNTGENIKVSAGYRRVELTGQNEKVIRGLVKEYSHTYTDLPLSFQINVSPNTNHYAQTFYILFEKPAIANGKPPRNMIRFYIQDENDIINFVSGFGGGRIPDLEKYTEIILNAFLGRPTGEITQTPDDGSPINEIFSNANRYLTATLRDNGSINFQWIKFANIANLQTYELRLFDGENLDLIDDKIIFYDLKKEPLPSLTWHRGQRNNTKLWAVIHIEYASGLTYDTTPLLIDISNELVFDLPTKLSENTQYSYVSDEQLGIDAFTLLKNPDSIIERCVP